MKKNVFSFHFFVSSIFDYQLSNAINQSFWDGLRVKWYAKIAVNPPSEGRDTGLATIDLILVIGKSKGNLKNVKSQGHVFLSNLTFHWSLRLLLQI